MANISEAILLKMINDPKLMKEIEKLSKQPSVKKTKAKKDLLPPTFVNKVTETCKLCGFVSIKWLSMSWDPNEKLHRSSCHATENLWPELLERSIYARRETCKHCTKRLSELEKHILIAKLIVLAERVYHNV